MKGYVEIEPGRNGLSYYTFRMGSIWGMVLDCGEDKADSHAEYGNMLCCHAFREQQTAYIERVIQCADAEYAAAGVKHKMIICHIPFTVRKQGRFDIEHEIYGKWVELLRDYIKPQLILCGHEHRRNIYHCGSEKDSYGQPCPVVIGAERIADEGRNYIAGAGLIFESNRMEVVFTDNLGRENELWKITE